MTRRATTSTTAMIATALASATNTPEAPPPCPASAGQQQHHPDHRHVLEDQDAQSGLAVLAPDLACVAQQLERYDRAAQSDEMVAGISMAVVRGADTLLMRGYGYADLEWSIPTPVDASAATRSAR